MLTEGFSTVLASLMKGGPSLRSNLFLAVGEGEAAWDENSPAEDRATARLVDESGRVLVLRRDVTFLDAVGRRSETPTTRLRVRAVFRPNQFNETLRETGLFGGRATAGRNSGVLMAYFVHPSIGKTPEMTLERIIRIDLTPRAFAPGSRVTRWLGNIRSEELHDLDNRQPQCQIEEIRFDHAFYMSGIEQAQQLGYDFCAFCFGRERSKR